MTVAPNAKKAVTSQIEVCDVAGDTGQNGHTFPILEANWNGWFYKSYSLTAGPTPGGCGPKYTFSPGTQITVEQAASPGVPVPNVDVTFSATNGSIVGGVPSLDIATVSMGTGLTVLTITDKTPPPPGNGTLELCKTQADQFVTGSFNFSLSGPNGYSDTQSVIAGQCNDVPVPSGNITVTEGVQFPYAMTSAATIPSTALVSSDNNKQTATVSVVPSGTTTLFITNATLTAYAKICKTLDRTQDNVLAGQTFTFDITATFNGTPVPGVPSTVQVTAGTYGTTTCAFLANNQGPIPLPLGTLVTATEVVPPNAPFAPVGTSISPSNLNDGSTASQAIFYVGNYAGSGTGNLGAGTVTQATFTDEALGYVEVCKTSDTIETGTPFQFSIGGVGSIPAVPVGQCSLGYPLPVGTTTISETPVAHVSTTVTQSAASGTQSGTTATVTVPYNTENIVTFDNEINTGQLKICKAETSSDAGLQNTAFTLSYSYTWNGELQTGSDSLTPGHCALPITVPVLNQDLTPIQISITEQTTTVPNIGLFNVQVVGPDTVVSTPSPLPWLVSSPSGSAATAVVNSLEGVTNVTFVNGIDIQNG